MNVIKQNSNHLSSPWKRGSTERTCLLCSKMPKSHFSTGQWSR